MAIEVNTPLWVQRLLVIALLIVLLLLTFSVLRPFLAPLVWGAILAYVCWPLNERILRWWPGRTGWAALCSTLVATLVVVVPLAWLIIVLREELVGAYQRVQAYLATAPHLPAALQDVPWLGAWLNQEIQRLSTNPDALQQQLVALSEETPFEVTRVLGSVGRNLFKLFFAVLSMFFLLRDGPRVFREVHAILESIMGPRVRDYLQAVGETTRAVLYALILGAIAQGSVAGVGYWMFGVDAPVLLGATTALVALMPFGAPMVWGSLGLWLLMKGDLWNGTGLLLWGILLVSWVDNIVRPLVISNATRMPFLLVVFGVLGGVLAFGLVGLFVGPVLLAVSLALWREWLEQHQPES